MATTRKSSTASRTSSTKSSNPPTKDYTDTEITDILSDRGLKVYSGYSKSNKKSVAIKFFPYHKNRPCKAYQIEGSFAALHHPNIVHFYDHADHIELGETQGSAIFMELCKVDFIQMTQRLAGHSDEKLVRTFFRQLVDGMEYLQRLGIAHLDLKPGNLLLGQDNKLRIADFESSYRQGDSKIDANGTDNFRAPEIITRSCENPFKADIFSAGLILFGFRFGCYAYMEQPVKDSEDYFNMLMDSPERYCELASGEVSGCDFKTNDDFKNLFIGMTRRNPEERFGIKEVKESKWFIGPVYTDEEVRSILKL